MDGMSGPVGMSCLSCLTKAFDSGDCDGSGSDGSLLTARALIPLWFSADAEAPA